MIKVRTYEGMANSDWTGTKRVSVGFVDDGFYLSVQLAVPLRPSDGQFDSLELGKMSRQELIDIREAIGRALAEESVAEEPTTEIVYNDPNGRDVPVSKR